jgi:hypothetical protein
MPYVRGSMQKRSPQQPIILRPADPRRVSCTVCKHTEFVHGDLGGRPCLFSACDCEGFTLGVVAATA